MSTQGPGLAMFSLWTQLHAGASERSSPPKQQEPRQETKQALLDQLLLVACSQGSSVGRKWF